MKFPKPALLLEPVFPWKMVSDSFDNTAVINGLEEKGLYDSYLVFIFVLDQC